MSMKSQTRRNAWFLKGPTWIGSVSGCKDTKIPIPLRPSSTSAGGACGNCKRQTRKKRQARKYLRNDRKNLRNETTQTPSAAPSAALLFPVFVRGYNFIEIEVFADTALALRRSVLDRWHSWR